MKLAVVVQRYGQAVNGGAELHARYIAEHLAPLFYNEGITAAQRALLRAADGLDADLEASKRLPPDIRRLPGNERNEGAPERD